MNSHQRPLQVTQSGGKGKKVVKIVELSFRFFWFQVS